MVRPTPSDTHPHASTLRNSLQASEQVERGTAQHGAEADHDDGGRGVENDVGRAVHARWGHEREGREDDGGRGVARGHECCDARASQTMNRHRGWTK